jgi:hypothetical protein
MIFAAAALTLSLELQRSTFDVLDAVDIEVVAHNPNKQPLSASFPAPSEYEIDLLRGSHVLWTSLRPQPIVAHFPPHARSFMPGPNVLAVFIWNGLASDGTAPAPGEYTIRVRMLDGGAQPQATMPVRFINTVPVIAVAKLKVGDEVTISGTLDASKSRLTDGSGSIALMRKLPAAPETTIAVRGYLTTAPDRTQGFFVERWAPVSEIPPAPVSIPSPAVRRH